MWAHLWARLGSSLFLADSHASADVSGRGVVDLELGDLVLKMAAERLPSNYLQICEKLVHT